MVIMKISILLICFITLTFIINSTNSQNISERLLNTVLSSPEACKVHNKTVWLDLFSDNASCEDPVGTEPHSGKKDLSYFWDTFIAPTDLTFTSHYDIVSEETYEVIRFVNITAAFPEDHVSTNQPAIILYKLQSEGQEIKIKSLQAYWILMNRVSEELYEKGGIWNLSKMGWKLIYNYGITGVCGYIKGFMGIGSYGIDWTNDFYSSINNQDYSKFTNLFKDKSLSQINLTYSNRKVQYAASALDSFWNEWVVPNKIVFEKKNFFNSGYNIVGAFQLLVNDLRINCAFINAFESKFKTISIWIDSNK